MYKRQYVDILGNDASGSSFLVKLIDTYSAYLIKQDEAETILTTYTNEYNTANATHSTELNTYNNLLAASEAGGAAVTYDQHTAYTTAKNNLGIALKKMNAATENKNQIDMMITNLTNAIKENHKIDLFPYVDLKGKTPNEGIVSFNDLPRYAMGYGSLFHSTSFTVETHMLKPFPFRVEATLAFMEELINWTSLNKSSIEKSRDKARGTCLLDYVPEWEKYYKILN